MMIKRRRFLRCLSIGSLTFTGIFSAKALYSSFNNDDMKDIIVIKPHHFIDIIISFGQGARTFEPHYYKHEVHSVSKKILEDKNIVLEMFFGIDDICKPCIHNKNGKCVDSIDTSFRPDAPKSKNEYNLLIDQRWSKRLEIVEGNKFTALDFCKIIKSKMGDITDIYKENPKNKIDQRKSDLLKGLAFYIKS